MYVDKTLSGIKAVQALSRLNRAHPKKHDVFVLDFLNDADTIRESFAPFYRATVLAEETDPNKLHDLQADLDQAQVYSQEQIDDFVKRYLGDAERDQLDPILDACVAAYKAELDEDGQVDFQGQGQGLRAHLRLPVLRLALLERRMGETVDLPELPGAQTSCTKRGRPIQRHSRRHRHGQLPGRETGDAEDTVSRRERRDWIG